MTALEKIMASDYSPTVKALAIQFEASLKWFAAAREAFDEERQFRFIPSSEKVAA